MDLQFDHQVPIRSDSISKLIELDSSFFPLPWGKEAWHGISLTPEKYIATILTVDSQVVGFTLYYAISPEKLAHLLKILVVAQWRGKGLASQLLRSDFVQLKESGYERVFLEVESENKDAILLYERCGFTQIHSKKGYYSNGDSALIFECHL